MARPWQQRDLRNCNVFPAAPTLGPCRGFLVCSCTHVQGGRNLPKARPMSDCTLCLSTLGNSIEGDPCSGSRAGTPDLDSDRVFLPTHPLNSVCGCIHPSRPRRDEATSATWRSECRGQGRKWSPAQPTSCARTHWSPSRREFPRSG